MKNTHYNVVGIFACAAVLVASTACSRRDDSKTKASVQTTANEESDKTAADKPDTELLATSNASVSSFPGGAPITAADLTASPPRLPAAPPKYDPANPISHEEYARFAWREFIFLNSPAKQNGSAPGPGVNPVVRGTISPTGSFVASGAKDFYQSGKSDSSNFSKHLLVWETFAHRSELFPRSSTPKADFQTVAPQYDFTNNEGSLSVAAHQARFNNLDESSQIGVDQIYFPHNGSTPSQNPNDDFQILFEAKVNQSEYDYIKSVTGSGTLPTSIELPNETIEVKAAWRPLSPEQVSSGHYHSAEALYYTSQGHQVGTFGLVGLHIIRKMENYPAFVYATFEHIENLDTGLYYITTYDELSYNGSVTGTGQAIANNGPSRNTIPLPTEGPVDPQHGYEFIPGHYTLPSNFAGPIKVVQPSTQTYGVKLANDEVKAAMTASPQFGASVWQYYQLKGIQVLPVNEDTSASGTVDPLTQDFFLANNVIESSQPGIQLFKGGIRFGKNAGGKRTFINDRAKPNILNVPGVDGNTVMGGCMGCHGNATYDNNGTTTSIFNFLISKENLLGQGGFEADEVDASAEAFLRRSEQYFVSE